MDSASCLAFDPHEIYDVERNEEHLNGLGLTENYLSSGYRSKQLGNLRAFYSPTVNRLLTTTRMPFTLLDDEFQLPRSVKTWQPFLLRNVFPPGTTLFNESKVRLASDPTMACLQAGAPLNIQKTDYFASLCSNEMAGRLIRLRTTGVPCFLGMDLMAKEGLLLDLEQSFCSNHIGVSSLAFTRDGHLVAVQQPQNSAQSAGLLITTASGSVDWQDVHNGDDLHTFLIRAIERELVEECGLQSLHPSLQGATRVVGFARLLMRGGKPEFFAVSLLDISFAELSETCQTAICITDPMNSCVTRTGVEEVVQGIDKFVEDHHARLSLPLYLNLRFLQDYVCSFPSEFGQLVA